MAPLPALHHQQTKSQSSSGARSASEHGLEFVKERKLEALQSTFKQKNVEIRTLKLEAAKEKFESHNSQAALSALVDSGIF